MTTEEKQELMHKTFGKGSGKCRYCTNLVVLERDRRYYKCRVFGISLSEATDWRVSCNACGMKDREYISC